MYSMKRNVLLLALCQALLFTGTSLLMSISALVGQQIAGPALATVPLGLLFLGSMLTTFPASLLMKRIGRTAGFMLGAAIGMIGASLCTYAVFQHHFGLLCAGSFLLGSANSFGQFYRFAAADVADDNYRSRAISLVLAGGVVAALIGPNLAAITRTGFAVTFAGSFAALIGVYFLSLMVTSLLRIAKPGAEERFGATRSLLKIARQPTFIVAVLNAMIGYGVMNLVMTSTPLAMVAEKHTFGSTALVIQWHVFAMFAPSFFTGHLIKRLGLLNVMMLGCVLLLACVAVNLAGVQVFHFTLALILLGLGWNFVFVGATTLLVETYSPAEKAKTQGLNDFLVFTTVMLTAFSSGAIHNAFGWQTINVGVIPFIVLALATVLWLRGRRQREALVAAEA